MTNLKHTEGKSESKSKRRYKQDFDVVIVGAGPAGLECARVLRDSNLSIIIIEKNEHMGPKTCAGGIVETVDLLGGSNSSLALDVDGNPHISYHCSLAAPSQLRYATKDGTTWHAEFVLGGLSGVGVGRFTSLALDIQGNPRIDRAHLHRVAIETCELIERICGGRWRIVNA